jgi:hypothetical protein
MASARELLEQADALMRRNRGRDGGAPTISGPRTMAPASLPRGPRTEIPVLTQALDRRVTPTLSPAMFPTPAQSVSMPSPGLPPPSEVADAPAAQRPVPRAFSPEVPVLTDAIEEIDAALLAVSAQTRPQGWDDEDHPDDSVLGLSPRSIMDTPARVTPEDYADDPQFAALAEEVRMQVFQRIDMFTDTGLSEALAERLKPAVDRAGADLVTAINQHVRDLLRTYVAEAIELELDRMRRSE